MEEILRCNEYETAYVPERPTPDENYSTDTASYLLIQLIAICFHRVYSWVYRELEKWWMLLNYFWEYYGFSLIVFAACN